MISPGEIYFADPDQLGPHPVIVVSREALNRGDYVLCVLCTSANFERRRHFPNTVAFTAGQFGLKKDCVARCEMVLTLHKSRLDMEHGPIGILDDEWQRNVIRAIGYVIDAECEPT
jgi:mRNA-degrading endonuclease toxin of MazEF toxin-antitoxin module